MGQGFFKSSKRNVYGIQLKELHDKVTQINANNVLWKEFVGFIWFRVQQYLLLLPF
jgi:hypothetical protein